MRFLRIKNEQTCYICGGTLMLNDEAIVQRVRHRNGYVIPQFFHPQCFIDWSNTSFLEQWERWRQSAMERPQKRTYHKHKITGRPRKYNHPVLVARLRGLIWYHKKQSHDTSDLQAQLNGLLINRP